MRKFLIAEGRNSPKISFDPENCYFEIKGKSYPENADNFYKDTVAWLEKYTLESPIRVIVDMNFQFISSASVICVLQMLRVFDALQDKGCEVKINWFYDNDDGEDDIKITGEDLESLTNLHFEYIPN